MQSKPPFWHMWSGYSKANKNDIHINLTGTNNKGPSPSLWNMPIYVYIYIASVAIVNRIRFPHSTIFQWNSFLQRALLRRFLQYYRTFSNIERVILYIFDSLRNSICRCGWLLLPQNYSTSHRCTSRNPITVCMCIQKHIFFFW